MNTLICYKKCTTCKGVEKIMKDQGLDYDLREIDKENPSIGELKDWREKSGLPLKRFFNTSGIIYRELALKDKLPAMTEEEQYAVLASDGMLVKRPLLITKDCVLTGFREKEWAELFT